MPDLFITQGRLAYLRALCRNEAYHAAATALVLIEELGKDDERVTATWERVREAREAHRAIGGDGLPNVVRDLRAAAGAPEVA